MDQRLAPGKLAHAYALTNCMDLLDLRPHRMPTTPKANAGILERHAWSNSGAALTIKFLRKANSYSCGLPRISFSASCRNAPTTTFVRQLIGCLEAATSSLTSIAVASARLASSVRPAM